MSRPSETSRRQTSRVGEENPGPQPRDRRLQVLAAAGVAVLVAGWLVVSAGEAGGPGFFFDGLVFVALAACMFVGGSIALKLAVEREEKLRLTLLVRNIELERRMSRDPLTDLLNRNHMLQAIERELAHAREVQKPLGLMLADIEDLATVNCEHGYEAGDRVLRAFSDFLVAQTRASDLAGRIGSDEFAIVLKDTSEKSIEAMRERVEMAMASNPLVDGDLRLSINARIGTAGFPWSGDTAEDLLRKAEASLNSARSEAALGPAGSTVPRIFRKALGDERP